MVSKLRGADGDGLERSCGAQRSDWLRSRELSDGVQVLQAWFSGHGFDTHRHDTYAIGVTDAGVQAFDYRGVAEISAPARRTASATASSMSRLRASTRPRARSAGGPAPCPSCANR
jgi:hypothetical protein